MPYFTSIQLDNGRDQLIAAYTGFNVNKRDAMAEHGNYNVSRDEVKAQIEALDQLGLDSSHLNARLNNKAGGNGFTKAVQSHKSTSKELINDMVFQHVALLRSLDKLNSFARCWADTVYGLVGEHERLFQLIYAIYQGEFGERKGGEQKARMLVKFALMNAVCEITGHQVQTKATIAKVMGINQRNFRLTWGKRYEWLLAQIKLIDERVMTHICTELKYPEYQGAITQSKHRFLKPIYQS